MELTRGILITFEGIDGVGKSTQIEMLGMKLRLEGLPVVFTKEPGASCGGETIRNLLFKDPSTKGMFPGQADCLLLYDHIGNVEGIIRPALINRYIVLSDRYADSQFAYGASSKRDTTPATMKAYEDLYGIEPNMIIFIRAMFDADADELWTLKRAMVRRGIEAGKQSGKTWGISHEEQYIIQKAYIKRFMEKPQTSTIYVHEQDTKEAISESIYLHVKRLINGLQ